MTGALITLLAAGLAAQAVAFLQQAGLVNVLTETASDTSWLISDASLVGRALHTIVGYADEPSELQAVI